jgi:hypothetical protein
MKAGTLCFVVLVMVVRTATVNAQAIGDCASVVQSIKSGASSLVSEATAWKACL